MRRLVLALALAAVLLVPAGVARASGPNGTLEGYVTSSAGTAIAGAAVTVQASDLPWTFQATTDSSGFYAISLPNHEYTVDVSSPAYDLNSTSAAVGSGLTTWFNVTLDPASARSARIQGHVTDSVTSAAVAAGRVVLTTPSWYWNPPYTNSSALNATGYYRMDLVPGTYDLSTDGVSGYVPYSYTYLYPNSGQSLWYNFTMTPMSLVAWINGTVENSVNYTPLAGVTVTATVSGFTFASSVSNATGAYSIHAPTGTIVIAADALGYAPTSTTDYIFWAGVTTLNVYLVPLTSGIHGKALNGLTGAGVPDALVVVSPFWGTGYYDQARTTATGAYGVNLPPDDYYVTASAPGFTTTYQYVTLGTAQVSWLNLTLWPIVATVEGYILDGATGSHVPNVYVYAYDVRSGYSTAALADGTGLYSLLLPPSPGITLRVTGTPPYAGAVVYMTSVAYVTTWMNITLPRVDAQIVANVTDGTTGLPISGAAVSVYWGYGSNFAYTASSGFATIGVPSGVTLYGYAAATGYYYWSGSVPTALPSGSVSLSIQLYPVLTANVTVQGYVKDGTTNASLSFAWVTASGYGPFTATDFTDSTGYYQLATVPAAQTILATDSGYSAATVSVSPVGSSTIWENFTLYPDSTAPRILNFTATPSANVGPGNPTKFSADVNESSLYGVRLSILMEMSSSAGVGTFAAAGTLPASSVSVTPAGPSDHAVASTWDTRMGVARLTDGTSSTWWPAISYGPFEFEVWGEWTNATYTSPTGAVAMFDMRSGDLLYLSTAYGLFGPSDVSASTFTPYTAGYQISLATSTIVGYTSITGPAFQVGTLSGTETAILPGGTYAGMLQAWDYAYNSASAVALFQAVGDTTPPVANAGPDQTVNQAALVTFDGTGSTDDVGITAYTWTFTDGTAQVLHGATPTYRFQNAGSFTVTLTVTDVGGNTATATMVVTVRDTTPPIVAITVPTESAKVNGSVSVTATASDNVGVVRVQFLVDGGLLGTVTTAPWTIALDTRSLANGNHTIKAIAYDAAGNSASTVRHITVLNAGSGGLLGGFDVLTTSLIALLVAGVVVALVLFLRRRKPRAPMPASYPSPPAPPPEAASPPAGERPGP